MNPRRVLFRILFGYDTHIDALNAECDRINDECMAANAENTRLLERNDRLGDALIAIEDAATLEEARELAKAALDAEAKKQDA